MSPPANAVLHDKSGQPDLPSAATGGGTGEQSPMLFCRARAAARADGRGSGGASALSRIRISAIRVQPAPSCHVRGCARCTGPHRPVMTRATMIHHDDGERVSHMLLQAEQAPAAELVPLGEHPITEGEAPAAGLSMNLDDQLISDGEAAAERYHKSRDQILPMARGLLAAKRKHPATRKFNAWLKGTTHYSRIGDHDRAALIKIGEQLDEREDVVVEFLKGTNLVSPQTIWVEIKKKLQPQPTLTASNCYDSNSADDPTDADASAAEDGSESGETEPDADPPPIKAAEPEASAKSHKLYGTGKRFDLVVLTPGKDDLARLRDANLDKLGECLPVREHVGDAAAIVIAAKVIDLPVVIDRLLPLCGFNRPKRILLRGQPASPDVIDAKVFVTAERGDIAFREPPGVWLDEAADLVDVAEGLYEASSTLHLFAAAKAKKAESRCVIVGGGSWKKLPVV